MNSSIRQGDWERLAGRFRRRQLVPFLPAVEGLYEDVTIRTRPVWRVVLAGVVALAGVGAAVAIWAYAGEYIGQELAAVLAPAAAGPGCLIALHWLTRVNQIRWRRGGREIIIRYGSFVSPKQVVLRAPDLEVELGERPSGRSGPMWRLSLTHKDKPGRVVVAESLNRSDLVAAHEALKSFLGGPDAQLLSAEPLQLPGGKIIDVSKAPMASSSATFRTMALKFPSPDVAVFQPTIICRLFFAFFAAGGVAALVIFIGLDSDRSVGSILLAGLVGSAFAIVGFAGLGGKLGARRIVFDRARGVLLGPKRRADTFGAEGLPLDDVAAVQICSKPDSGTGPEVYLELNLVLREPAGERLNLTCHGDRKNLRADAKKLAEFLDRPLLDHTEQS